jgi:DNA-binding IclR family transcriptional regulator
MSQAIPLAQEIRDMTPAGQTTRRPNRVFAVDRALLLLRCFEANGETRSLASLARQTRLSKSTILRISGSLCDGGFLQRNDAGLFGLGPELRRLGSLDGLADDLGGLVRTALRSVVATTHESASFYVREGQFRICLFCDNSPRLIRNHPVEGDQLSLDVGAAGQILRAYSKYAKEPRLAAIRRRGWAVSEGDWHPDLAAISVPVLNKQEELLGALTASARLSRFTGEQREQIKETLMAEVRALSEKVKLLNVDDLMAVRRLPCAEMRS